MSAWLLALVLCVPASAQVVEAVRVAAPSAAGAAGAAVGSAAGVATIPQASVLAPTLGWGATLSAPPARVHFAPPAAPVSPASAASVESAPRAETAPGRAAARKDSVPPSILQAGRAVPNAAAFQGQQQGEGLSPESVPEGSEAAGRF